MLRRPRNKFEYERKMMLALVSLNWRPKTSTIVAFDIKEPRDNVFQGFVKIARFFCLLILKKIFLTKLKGYPHLFVTGNFLYNQFRNKEENSDGTENLFLYRRISVKSVFVRTIFDCSYYCRCYCDCRFAVVVFHWQVLASLGRDLVISFSF